MADALDSPAGGGAVPVSVPTRTRADVSWLMLQQLLESALPIGGFSHSFGLETMVQEGRIRTSADLERYAETMLLLQSWATLDAMIVKAVYECPTDDWERAWRIERLVHLQRAAAESRAAAGKMGRRLLRLAASVHPGLDLSPLEEAFRSGRSLATHPLVFGFLCRRLGFPLHQAVQGLLYGNIVTCVNSALRLMAIGQTEGQAIIARLIPLIAEGWELANRLEPEDAHGNTPLAELMAMRHETLYSRLFMS
ncbi:MULTISPECIES: urease accessory protein UreF [Thermobacillus]|uniref:Urease accessory protein UreF n=1 Tax=Thermobacillus composti (strain DSM 18247 / JCM 13945 / KWC4) TaxID=717605 RepID=L0EE62_THECK|nr:MULTISPECIES: urease accessory protein UreF [Thermobacillus]AGA58578.1 urease accessory protein UreF [Thermobacillus composti KWC4]